ncbi:MAG: transporter substrate-binding domain-containing protein [Pseudomonadota bacterium]
MKTAKIHRVLPPDRSAPDSGMSRAVPAFWRLPVLLGFGILFLFLVTGAPWSAASADDMPLDPHRNLLQESVAEKVRMLSRTKLSTLIVDNYYPYTFMNSQGLADGFSVDLIRAVTQVMGLELDIQAGTWDRARSALETGEIDLLPMMAYSEERAVVFDFSVPHTISFDAVFVVKGRNHFKSMADLMGRTVIVMKNDVAHDYLISKGITLPEKIVLADSLPEALRFLALGKGDAALMPKLVGLLHLKKMGLGNLEASPVVVDDYQRRFSFAVKKGDSLLLNRLSEGLSIVKATGTLDQIHQKWFGVVEPAPVSLQSVMKYILAVFAALMLIVAVIIAWSLSLRKQVALRTGKLKQEIVEHMRVKDDLLETKQRLELATASAKLGVWEWNIPDNILQWDDQMFDLYGITRNTFPGCVEAWQNGLHPDDRELAMEASRLAVQGEKDYDTEFRIVHPDGAVKNLKAHALIIRDNSGKALKMIGINRDITERKRAEQDLKESNTKFMSLVGNVPGYIAYVNAETLHYEFVNDVFEKSFGIPREKIIGSHIKEIIGETSYQVSSKNIEEVRSGKSVSYENIYDLVSGKHWIQVNYAPIIDPDGRVASFVILGYDITERKRAEEALVCVNENLEQRVAQEVENNLEQERMLIQQSRLAAMGEMIGNIAHQWRQPLNALGLLLYNIKDAYRFNTLDAEYLDQAVADGRRMVQKMSTTISDFSNFFRPDKESSVFSAMKQIKDAIALVESSFLNSNISIHIDAPHDLNLMGFPNEYSQVLLNLLSNAKEAILAGNQPHRPSSGRVDIVLTERGGQAIVSVRDNGSGIPMDILGRIFDPYFSTKESGTGIGLYMSKMIIERNMKGSLTARNIEGGAEFIVASPLAKDGPYEPYR